LNKTEGGRKIPKIFEGGL